MKTNQTRLTLEALETRDVPTVFAPVPSFYQLGGLAHPAPATNYLVQNYANQQLNQVMRAAAFQQAQSVSPYALMQNGLESGLANALVQARLGASVAPSLLDARPVSQLQYNQAASRIQAGGYNLPYVLNQGGFRADTLTIGGYQSLSQMNANQLGQAALNDSYLSLMSGTLTARVTNQYLTQHYTNGTLNGVNGVGMMNAVGLGRGGVTPIAQAQAIGAFGVARPAGTGTGSPFMDALLGHR